MSKRSDRSRDEYWTDEISVLFTSLWGWTPETWGTIGWTGDPGRTHRDRLLRELTDPFITAAYVTSNKSYTDPDLKGMIAGFYLVSHETGDRHDFTHPIHYERSPEKWQHSLRALRAFTYLPEYRLNAYEFEPSLREGSAQAIGYWGKLLTDPAQIALLRQTPYVEVEVYSSRNSSAKTGNDLPAAGKVMAGPASADGYVVSQGTLNLPRQLYVLRLEGNTNAYLGEPAKGRFIYKIGLAASPELRRQAFQKALPRGAFRWRVDRTSKQEGVKDFSFNAAVAAEDAMKEYLARCAEWLGGEFYLATKAQIDEAWAAGRAAISGD